MGKGKEGKRERRLGRERKGPLPVPSSDYRLFPFAHALFSRLPLFAPVTQAHIVLQLRVRLVPLEYHTTRQDKTRRFISLCSILHVIQIELTKTKKYIYISKEYRL